VGLRGSVSRAVEKDWASMLLSWAARLVRGEGVLGRGGLFRCSWRDSVRCVSSELCEAEHCVDHSWRALGGTGKAIRRLRGVVDVSVCCSPLRDERCRERWMR
jgi:hypothetical protein